MGNKNIDELAHGDFKSYDGINTPVGNGVESYVGCIKRARFAHVFDKAGVCRPVLEIQTATAGAGHNNNSTALEAIGYVQTILGEDQEGFRIVAPEIEKDSKSDKHGSCSVYIVGDVVKAVDGMANNNRGFGGYVVDELYNVASEIGLSEVELPLKSHERREAITKPSESHPNHG